MSAGGSIPVAKLAEPRPEGGGSTQGEQGRSLIVAAQSHRCLIMGLNSAICRVWPSLANGAHRPRQAAHCLIDLRQRDDAKAQSGLMSGYCLIFAFDITEFA